MLRMLVILFVGLGVGACARARKLVPLLPSQTMPQAAACMAEGHGEQGLKLLTDTLCQRPEVAKHLKTGTNAPAAARLVTQDIALVHAWVAAWDLQGRAPQAKDKLLQCRRDEPLTTLLEVVLADATGDWGRAEQLSAQPFTDVPEPLRAELRLRHALALLHQGRVQTALAELHAAIGDAPTHGGLRIALAQAYLANGERSCVGHALWPLLSLQEAPSESIVARARSLLEAAREAGAPPMTRADWAEHADLTRLAAGGALAPEDLQHVLLIAKISLQPRLFTWCALILLREGETALGRRLLERAQQALPLDPNPPRLLAAHQLTDNDYDGALAALLEAVRRDPFDIENQVMLATIADKVGAFAQAQGAYEALVRLAPEDAGYHAALQKARQRAAQNG